MAKQEDLEKIQQLGIDLKLDFILNHSSVLSKQFQDILINGKASKYKDFFIDWNQFWSGKGSMTKEGYIQPDSKRLKDVIKVPVIAVNRINTPEIANEILNAGDADLISMARPLLADPEFFNK